MEKKERKASVEDKGGVPETGFCFPCTEIIIVIDQERQKQQQQQPKRSKSGV